MRGLGGGVDDLIGDTDRQRGQGGQFLGDRQRPMQVFTGGGYLAG